MTKHLPVLQLFPTCLEIFLSMHYINLHFTLLYLLPNVSQNACTVHIVAYCYTANINDIYKHKKPSCC